jgi:hypothetical protein
MFQIFLPPRTGMVHPRIARNKMRFTKNKLKAPATILLNVFIAFASTVTK